MTVSSDPEQNGSRRSIGGTGLAIIIGLLAIHLVIGTGCYRFAVVADGAEYLRMAENLLQSGQFTLDGENPIVGKPPGFPVLLACWLRLAGTIQGFQVLQLFLLFVAYSMIALTGKELGGPAAGLLTLGVLCLLWPLDDLAAQPISEPAFLAFAAAGIWASIRALTRDARLMAVIAGAALAAATYMRPITLLFPIFLAIAVLVSRRGGRRAVVTLAVIHTLLVLPWIARNYMVCGKLVPMVANWGPAFFLTSEESWQTYYFEGSGKSRESEEFLALTGSESEFNCGPAERIRQEALKRIAEAPGAYLWRGVRQTVYAWSYLPGYRSSRNPSTPEF